MYTLLALVLVEDLDAELQLLLHVLEEVAAVPRHLLINFSMPTCSRLQLL
tara:strand:+ start:1835 stop:1984 length:150 start_codon:yes stop_codon:yes gene_type:complete